VQQNICRGCLNPVTSTGRTSVDIGARANLELLDKFCYLGDVFSVYGDADAPVNPDWFYLSGAGSPKRVVKRLCVCVCVRACDRKSVLMLAVVKTADF